MQMMINKIIGYTIGVINRSNRKIPFIVPYSAILNKKQTAIRSFISFNDLITEEFGLTDDQVLLHSFSEKFNLLLGLKPSMIIDDPIYTEDLKGIKNVEIAFTYWKQMISILKDQSYLHYYWFTKKIDYQVKPKKHRMRRIYFSDQKIIFKLMVIERTHHYSIQCKAYLNDVNVSVQALFPPRHPFFISLKQDHYLHYLFSSLEEAATISEFVEWNYNRRISKDHFETFKRTILLPLADVIAVEYQ